MNNRGSYAMLIAITVVALISVAAFSAKSIELQSIGMKGAKITELKGIHQNLEIILDKAASDAMADEARTGCAPKASYSSVKTYFDNVLNEINLKTGYACSGSVAASVAQSFSYTLSCGREFSDFNADYSRIINVSKNVSASMQDIDPGPGTNNQCVLTVKDLQSGKCDVTENTLICP